MRRILIGLAALAVSLASAGPARADRVLAMPKHGTYLGVYHASVAGPPSRPLSLVRYPGAKMRIVHRFHAWWGPDRFLNRPWLAAVQRSGGIPMVTWEPWRVGHGKRTTRGVVRRIARGRYDAYIRRWARDVRAYGQPIALRLMHEMNGAWYPWSARSQGNSPAAFRKAWRRVWRIFRETGARNVTWVFSVDSSAGGKPTSRQAMRRFYPGRRYVDWVGLSGFNWAHRRYGRSLSFARAFTRAYREVRGFRRPVMLAEVGSATVRGARAERFVRDALRTARRRFPRVGAVVWYDARHPQRDFRLRAGALRAFRGGARSAAVQPGLRFRER